MKGSENMAIVRVHMRSYRIVKGKKEYQAEVSSNAGTHGLWVPEENLKKYPKEFIKLR
jgi:hypothetical protein